MTTAMRDENKLEFKVELLHSDSKTPTKVHETDSGFDAYAHNIQCFYDTENNKVEWDPSIFNNELWTAVIRPGWRCLVGLGIAVTVGKGYEVQIRSRSGLALKQGLIVANGIGTIDELYRGQVCAAFINTTNTDITIKQGDKIAQLVPVPIILPQLIVCKLDDTARGNCGFGSSGR